MRYDIIEAMSIPVLIKRVNEKIEGGWEPTGGIIKHDSYFYQPIFKKGDKP